MCGSRQGADLVLRPLTALALVTWFFWTTGLPARAEPPSASAVPAAEDRFEDFLRFERGSEQKDSFSQQPGPGCSSRSLSNERGLPGLDQWWSQIVAWRTEAPGGRPSDQAIVLHGTGYNYRRGPSGPAAVPLRY